MIPLLPLPIQPESGTRSSHIHCVSWKQHQWQKSDYCSLVRCSADTEERATSSHYNCTALISQQPPAFSLLQEERLKSSSPRQKIFHSTPKEYNSWNMCLADNLLRPLLGSGYLEALVQFWCDSWGRRWGYGFMCCGSFKYLFWRHSHESMDFQYIRENIHVWIMLKAIAMVVTAVSSRIQVKSLPSLPHLHTWTIELGSDTVSADPKIR